MIKSAKPGKQRNYRRKAPQHVRRKMMSSHLSSELRKKLGKRSLPVRKGDEVKVMRGAFKGVSGKVELVKRKILKVFIDNAKIVKKSGDKVKVGIDPSNLLITSLNLSDEKRLRSEAK